jgi:hypothetical protein
VIYQHPLAYLIGLEGLALLRAWAGNYDYDHRFVEARLAEARRLLADETLTSAVGVQRLVSPSGQRHVLVAHTGRPSGR